MSPPPHVLAQRAKLHADLDRHLDQVWEEQLPFDLIIRVSGERGMPYVATVEREERLQYGGRRRA